MVVKSYKIVFLFFLFITHFVTAQQDYITGNLLDFETEEPIAFASIRIKDRALGVISNLDGSFKIPMKFSEYGDIIEISSMGYQVLEIELSDLSLFESNLVRLKPNIEMLNEVVLVSKRKKGLKPEAIIQNAIENIPKNYPLSPFSYIGYYRDYQVKNGSRFNFNEAILEVFDSGFATGDFENTNYKLYHYTRNLAFPRDTIGEKPYDNQNKFIPGAEVESRKGNELLILRNMDAIRNYKVDTYSYVYRFAHDFIENHWFRKKPDVKLGNDVLYSLEFSKRTSKYLVFGTIAISKTSFAIYKFDYNVYVRGEEVKPNVTYADLKKGTSSLFSVKVGYKRYNGSMYPSYISFNNQFNAYGKSILRAEKVSLDFPDKFVLVNFSTIPDQKDGQKTSRYDLKYRDQKLKIKHIVLDGKSAKLYLSKSEWRRLEEMVVKDAEYKTSNLNIVVSRMKDIEGNSINDPEEIQFEQYREFFVQRINPQSHSKNNNRYMRKDRPIFENQIFDKPDDFSDYWMNTPNNDERE